MYEDILKYTSRDVWYQPVWIGWITQAKAMYIIYTWNKITKTESDEVNKWNKIVW